MNCWLIFASDCSRPCNCLSEHPLVLNSNPGILEGDNVIITDEDARIPCCVATVSNIRSFKINEEPRIYVYLKNCGIPNENKMDKVIKVIRSVSLSIKVMNVDVDLCI